MNPLSATIITFNEERNIGRCLEALKKIADEIIILDSFSTDQTIEICNQYDVKFIQRKWEGYSSAKNYVNALASHNYIFSVDADEVPDSELIATILSLKKSGFSGAYRINRMTNYCGKWIKHSGWYPDRKIRLFPKNKALWQGEFVHEELIIDEGLVVSNLKGHLQHYSYYNYEEHRERADKYSLLTAQKLHATGKKVGDMKPVLSAIGRFISMYFLKLGFLDGRMGFKIAQISAKSNLLKYKELIRLNRNKSD
jgi:glycosyltransferase involved in cell wall biosynthesis